MRAPLQEGSFPFPVKYGYCAVGLVEAADEAPELVGRSVLCLHPHQTRFAAPISMLTPLPEALSPRRAVLAANMETALNALWDSGAGPGDRIVVVGAGLVGLLVAYLAAGLPGADVTVVDLDASRQPIAESFGARFATPADFGSPGDADVVFHASAAAAGLAVALGAAGLEARVVELSWYGEGDVPAPLGGAFHSRRLTLVSSQVGQVAPSRRPRWSYGRRLAKALEPYIQPGDMAKICRPVDWFGLNHYGPIFCKASTEYMHGFAWGGNFGLPDGMHFEWVGEARNTWQYPSTYCPNLPGGVVAATAVPTARDTMFAD
jgi:NADPH:quinone reductase-like Zn-dependent oxidoreductase